MGLSVSVGLSVSLSVNLSEDPSVRLPVSVIGTVSKSSSVQSSWMIVNGGSLKGCEEYL